MMTIDAGAGAIPEKQIEYWPIARLRPYAQNPRTHSPEQVRRLVASIKEFGFTVPALVDEQGVLIAGHGRLLAAQSLGMERIPVIRLEHLTPAQVRAYRLADNQLTLLGEWDEEMLSGELSGLSEDGFDLDLLGFDDSEIERLLTQTSEPIAEVADDALDDIPEPPREVVSRPGDLWLLGNHRLLCGNSTDSNAVATVMNGELASLLFTSPPYASQRDYTTGGVGDWDKLMQDIFINLPMREDGQILINLGLVHRNSEWHPYWQEWVEWMRSQGWRRFGWYVWDQGAGLPGDWQGRFAPSHEFIFHFNKNNKRPNKIIAKRPENIVACTKERLLRAKDGKTHLAHSPNTGLNTNKIPDSVVRVERQHGGIGPGLDHPAVFPVKLAEFIFNSYSNKKNIVFEPFCGAGSCVIAGERTGRLVRAVELAQEYVDISVMRWDRQFPDEPATLDGDGRSFAEIRAERLA